MRVSLERLIKFLVSRKASVDLERLNETFGCQTKAKTLGADPSLPFTLDLGDGDKLCQVERCKHHSIDDKYLLYKGRVCVLVIGDFHI